MLSVRSVKFLQNVQKSDKVAVQFMLRKAQNDVNTITGKNVRYIQDQIGIYCDLLAVSPSWLKQKLNFCEISNGDRWKVNLIKEVTNIRHSVLFLEHEDSSESFLANDQLQEILNFVSSF